MAKNHVLLRHFIATTSDYPTVWWDDSVRHHWMVERRMQHCFENMLDNYMYYILLL